MTNKRITNLVGITILCFLILFCYSEVLEWMYHRYMSPDSYYSHGFFVPFISLFLVWREKDRLQDMEQSCSHLGLVLVCMSLLFHVVGTAIYIFSVSGFSLFFLIAGLSLFLFGAQITRIVVFPLVFLVFMFPVPIAFISIVSFPLKMFAAKVGVWVVSLLGISILREGFNISIPSGTLLIGNPCSGLRSLISFLALGALYAHLTTLPLLKKWFLIVISVPIALLTNIVRVSILILVSHYWGLAAATPDTIVHTGSGLFVFAIGILLLFLGSRVLK